MGESMYISTNSLAIKAMCQTLVVSYVTVYTCRSRLMMNFVCQDTVSLSQVKVCISPRRLADELCVNFRQFVTGDNLYIPSRLMMNCICQDKTLSLSQVKVCTSPKCFAIEVIYESTTGRLS